MQRYGLFFIQQNKFTECPYMTYENVSQKKRFYDQSGHKTSFINRINMLVSNMKFSWELIGVDNLMC